LYITILERFGELVFRRTCVSLCDLNVELEASTSLFA